MTPTTAIALSLPLSSLVRVSRLGLCGMVERAGHPGARQSGGAEKAPRSGGRGGAWRRRRGGWRMEKRATRVCGAGGMAGAAVQIGERPSEAI